jgi:hypothetical protein
MIVSLAILFRCPPSALEGLDDQTIATIFDVLEETRKP